MSSLKFCIGKEKTFSFVKTVIICGLKQVRATVLPNYLQFTVSLYTAGMSLLNVGPNTDSHGVMLQGLVTALDSLIWVFPVPPL